MAAKLLSSGGLQSSGSVTGDFDFSGDSAFLSFDPRVFGLGPVASAGAVTAGGAAASATVNDSGSPQLVEVISGPLFVGGVDPIALSDVASGVRVEVDGGYLVGTAQIGAVTESQPIQFNGSSFTVLPIVFVDGDGLIVISGTNLGAALYGGHMIVSSGGVVGRTDVDQGVQDVLSGGVAIGAVVGIGNPDFFGDGGLQTVWAGGVASNTAILRGGTEDVFGTASGTSVGATGLELVESGGVINGATLMGGTLEIMSGGTAGSSTIAFARSGSELVLHDATTFDGSIAGFGSSDSIDLGNINLSGATLSYSGDASSGMLTIGDGTHVANLSVDGDYTAANFRVADDGHGGILITEQALPSALVLNNALFRGFFVSNDDYSYYGFGSYAVGVRAGQTEVVSAGQTDAPTIVADGSQMVVQSGGTADYAYVSSGSAELVETGGVAAGAVLDGGTLEIMSGGTGTGIIAFSWGGGLLKLDDATSFRGSILVDLHGSASIDLANVAFSAATLGYADSSTSEPEPDPYGPLITQHSGTLTVADGAHVATLAMIGQYTAANFQLADDGHGGTMVTEQPVSSGASLATPH